MTPQPCEDDDAPSVGEPNPSSADGRKRAYTHPRIPCTAPDDWTMIAIVDNGAKYDNATGNLTSWQ